VPGLEAAERVDVDVSGNSFATINVEAAPRIMLAGHVDEIGVMVTYIDDDGYLSFDPIGGWDHQVFVGQRVQVLGRAGAVAGVIGKKAIHTMKADERDKVSKVTDLWIDIGAANRKEAEGMVRVGDAAVLDARALLLPNGRIVSRSIDNRIGAYVVAEAVRLLATARPRHAAVLAVASTQEEIACAVVRALELRISRGEEGRLTRVSDDDAIDVSPSWGPDGRLYFASDRSGVYDVYARDPDGRLRQVTNVETGAFEPQVSPDGRVLAFVSYSRAGYDLELLRAVCAAVDIPVIASGGVGTLEHLAEGLTVADAALAASIFHDGQHTVQEAKAFCRARGLEVRP